MSRPIARLLAMLLFASLLLSSGCASQSKSKSNAGASSTTAMAGAVAGASSLFNSLGGLTGVQALASAFGVNLAGNSAVAAILGGVGIESAKTGLVNSLAKASGQQLAAGSVDLLGALSDKGLNPAAIEGVGKALIDAGTSRQLKPDQMASLASLWEPVGKSLLAGN
jgi:hypothetical protein